MWMKNKVHSPCTLCKRQCHPLSCYFLFGNWIGWKERYCNHAARFYLFCIPVKHDANSSLSCSSLPWYMYLCQKCWGHVGVWHFTIGVNKRQERGMFLHLRPWIMFKSLYWEMLDNIQSDIKGEDIYHIVTGVAKQNKEFTVCVVWNRQMRPQWKCPDFSMV